MTVYLIGIGAGNPKGLTAEAKERIEESRYLIGASRMLAPYRKSECKILFDCYKADEIAQYINEISKSDGDTGSIAVLFSGDIGFYSGARALLEKLDGFQTELICGISSAAYFCAKLKIPWEDVALCSLHGRKCSIISKINRNKRTFVLLNGPKGLAELLDKLEYFDMKEVVVHIGQRLSYEDEKILTFRFEDFDRIKQCEFDKLIVVLIENPLYDKKIHASIPDEEFIRGNVPMTKREIRCVSIGRLGLESDSVVYDIGAGSGSVSVEMAIKSPDIQVYAVEKEKEAVLLIEKNRKRFKADNIEIIEGEAPAVLDGLPKPTHAFIGGSSGSIREIIECIWKKNPLTIIVTNTISLNTLAQVMEVINERYEIMTDIVQLQGACGKKVGKHHMMMGQNPIYIITMVKNIRD